MKITLNGKDVEIDAAFPLQLRDLRRLKKEFSVELSAGVSDDVEKQFGFFIVVLQKANPEITPDDVDAMTLTQMNAVSKAASEASFVVDVPSSASSTS